MYGNKMPDTIRRWR